MEGKSLDDLINTDRKSGRNFRRGGAKSAVPRIRKAGGAIQKQRRQRPQGDVEMSGPGNNQNGAKRSRSSNRPQRPNEKRLANRKQRLQQMKERKDNRAQGRSLVRKPIRGSNNQQRRDRGQQQRPKQQQRPHQNQPQKQAPAQAVNTNEPVANRKLKVRNIDAHTVTTQDLHKLFSKSGPLVSARFDKNEFGNYLGSATLIYDRNASAKNAIRDYNQAQLDNRTMTVEFAKPMVQTTPAAPKRQPSNANVKKGGLERRPRPGQQAPLGRRNAAGGIRATGRRPRPGAKRPAAGNGQASGGRKTLNVTGSSASRNRQRDRRAARSARRDRK